MKKSSKSSSLSSYMLKYSHLLTQGFGENRTSQEKLLKHMGYFEAWSEWREGRRVVSSYVDFDTTKYQYRLLNPTPLDCITGYIMEYALGERDFKRLPQRRRNSIDGYILSYCC